MSVHAAAVLTSDPCDIARCTSDCGISVAPLSAAAAGPAGTGAGLQGGSL